MVRAVLLASTVAGVALIAAVAAFASGKRRRALPTVAGSGEGGYAAAAVRASRRPTAWVVAFAAAACTLGGAAVVFVSGDGIPAGVRSLAGLVFGVGLAAVASFYLFYGTVVTARGHGLTDAQAVALGSWVFALALLVAVVARLLGVL